MVLLHQDLAAASGLATRTRRIVSEKDNGPIGPGIASTATGPSYFETGAYYTRPWQIAAIVFLLASFLFGWTIPGRQLVNGRVSSTDIRRLLFRCAVYAWILAVVAVIVASFTPLCVGQDNGDGINNRQMCLIFAISSSLFYTAVSLPVILLSSFLSAPILLRSSARYSW